MIFSTSVSICLSDDKHFLIKDLCEGTSTISDISCHDAPFPAANKKAAKAFRPAGLLSAFVAYNI
jgi:hypothetical protein